MKTQFYSQSLQGSGRCPPMLLRMTLNLKATHYRCEPMEKRPSQQPPWKSNLHTPPRRGRFSLLFEVPAGIISPQRMSSAFRERVRGGQPPMTGEHRGACIPGAHTPPLQGHHTQILVSEYRVPAGSPCLRTDSASQHQSGSPVGGSWGLTGN